MSLKTSFQRLPVRQQAGFLRIVVKALDSALARDDQWYMAPLLLNAGVALGEPYDSQASILDRTVDTYLMFTIHRLLLRNPGTLVNTSHLSVAYLQLYGAGQLGKHVTVDEMGRKAGVMPHACELVRRDLMDMVQWCREAELHVRVLEAGF